MAVSVGNVPGLQERRFLILCDTRHNFWDFTGPLAGVGFIARKRASDNGWLVADRWVVLLALLGRDSEFVSSVIRLFILRKFTVYLLKFTVYIYVNSNSILVNKIIVK